MIATQKLDEGLERFDEHLQDFTKARQGMLDLLRRVQQDPTTKVTEALGKALVVMIAESKYLASSCKDVEEFLRGVLGEAHLEVQRAKGRELPHTVQAAAQLATQEAGLNAFFANATPMRQFSPSAPFTENANRCSACGCAKRDHAGLKIDGVTDLWCMEVCAGCDRCLPGPERSSHYYRCVGDGKRTYPADDPRVRIVRGIVGVMLLTPSGVQKTHRVFVSDGQGSPCLQCGKQRKEHHSSGSAALCDESPLEQTRAAREAGGGL